MAKYGLTKNLGQRTAIKRDASGKRIGGGKLITEDIQQKAAADIEGLEVIADNTAEVLAAFDSAIVRALEEIGLVAEGYAKKLCPVDTGRLRNSITHTIDSEAAYIGTNVEYGPYVELGTSCHKAQPFLAPAAESHASTYRAIMEKHLFWRSVTLTGNQTAEAGARLEAIAMTSEDLYMVMDDTNNYPFDMLPEIDSELEAKLMREIDAIQEDIWGRTGKPRLLRDGAMALA